MQPEAKLKKKLKQHFEKWAPDLYWQNNVQSRFSQAGTPDCEMTLLGSHVWLELKMPKGKLSPLQNICHDNIRAAGGKVFTIYGYDETMIAEIKSYLVKGAK